MIKLSVPEMDKMWASSFPLVCKLGHPLCLGWELIIILVHITEIFQCDIEHVSTSTLLVHDSGQASEQVVYYDQICCGSAGIVKPM